jgi:uncharacterized protein YutE (UPF0331/DUF86 family)
MEEQRIKRYKEKIKFIKETTDNLESWTVDINKTYFQNKLELQKKYGIYHAFQIAVEIISDISAMVIKDLKDIPKDDYSNIDILRKKGIIDFNLSVNIKEAIGLRNRIMHDYNGLDDKIAYSRLVELLKSFKQFFKVILKWLESSY